MDSGQHSPRPVAVARPRAAVVERTSISPLSHSKTGRAGEASKDPMPEPIRPKARRRGEIEIIAHRAGKLAPPADL